MLEHPRGSTAAAHPDKCLINNNFIGKLLKVRITVDHNTGMGEWPWKWSVLPECFSSCYLVSVSLRKPYALIHHILCLSKLRCCSPSAGCDGLVNIHGEDYIKRSPNLSLNEQISLGRVG